MLPISDNQIILIAYTLEQGKGGIAGIARLAAKALAEEHLLAKIIVFKGANDKEQKLFNVPVKYCKGRISEFLFNFYRASLNNKHILFDGCHTAQLNLFRMRISYKSAVFLHGIEIWEHSKWRYLISTRKADYHIYNSHYTKKRTSRLHKNLKNAFSICWLGTEKNSAGSQMKQEDKITSPKVLMVGRIDSRENYKGHKETIACWPKVLQAVPGATLEIAGEGSGLECMKGVAIKTGVGNSVTFHGFVSDSLLERLYSESLLFVMPSRGEGFGIVYIEAMRHGLPVIASCHDAGNEISKHGETGFNVDLNNSDELSERIVQLLLDHNLRKSMSENSLNRWKSHFTFSKFKERFIPAIENFLKQ